MRRPVQSLTFQRLLCATKFPMPPAGRRLYLAGAGRMSRSLHGGSSRRSSPVTPPCISGWRQQRRTPRRRCGSCCRHAAPVVWPHSPPPSTLLAAERVSSTRPASFLHCRCCRRLDAVVDLFSPATLLRGVFVKSCQVVQLESRLLSRHVVRVANCCQTHRPQVRRRKLTIRYEMLF